FKILFVDRNRDQPPEDVDVDDRFLRNEHSQEHSCMTGPQARALDSNTITWAKPRDGANSAQREDVIDRILDQLFDNAFTDHSMRFAEAHEAQDATNRSDPVPETWTAKNVASEHGKRFG